MEGKEVGERNEKIEGKGAKRLLYGLNAVLLLL